jgi:hypothetical protein
MEQLNALSKESGTIRQIIRLYLGKNKQLFTKRAADFLGEEHANYEPEQDRNALLYRFVSGVFEPFLKVDTVRRQVDYFTATIIRLAEADRDAFDAMMVRFEASGFLVNLQRDCLELYPEIFEAELPLRAALFLDFTEDQGRGTAARISLADFNTYKDLYKDISEVFGRQLILVAAINNLDKRGNADAFLKPKDGNALSSLDKLADRTLADRFKYLDDSWYSVDAAVVDTGLRNAIAHYLTEYDELTQLVTYFSEKEGIRQEHEETMTLLDFMRMILALFREMHSVHHLIKSLLFYDALIRHRV